MTKTNKLVWKIGGEAGYGIMSTGLMFAKACLRGNLHIFDYTEYPSLIRGGHNSYTVRVEDKEIHSQIQITNILAALNKETIDLHLHQLTKNGVLLYDNDESPVDKTKLRKDISYLHIPLSKIVRDIQGERVMRNNVLLGASFAVVSYDFAIVEHIIKDFFKSKGDAVINHNIALAKAGYDYITTNYKEVIKQFPNKLKKVEENKEHIFLTGNEACSLGALAAGCKFVSIYPMTPISGILSLMEHYEQRFSIVVKQPEDEISAVNMAIGAWHAGVRALTATSGGGFCLMTEGLGLAAMTETPLVVINGMRGGPSTGLPTWTEQGDLQFILHASHGEFPRIVIAPGDVDDAYNLMIDAFNLAEKYQLVVIVLTDKHLNESHKSLKKFSFETIRIERGKFLTDEQLKELAVSKQEYKRYAFVDDGVSSRVMPGQEHGLFIASSDEHNESGFFYEDADNRKKMMHKRFKKIETAMKDIPQPKLVGEKDAELTFISFGSTKGAIFEAMHFLADKKIKANFLQIKYLDPFPTESVINIIKNAKNVVCVECNYTGQLAALIKEKTGIEIKHNLRKYDGRPFFPEEINDYVMNNKRFI